MPAVVVTRERAHKINPTNKKGREEKVPTDRRKNHNKSVPREVPMADLNQTVAAVFLGHLNSFLRLILRSEMTPV